MTITGKHRTIFRLLLAAVLCFGFLYFSAGDSYAQAIADSLKLGKQAAATAEQYADVQLGEPARDGNGLVKLFFAAAGLITLCVVLVAIMMSKVAELTGFNPLARFNSNALNPRIFLLFFLAGAVGLVWEFNLHAKYVLMGSAASEHGMEIDRMLRNTIIITGIVFVITQTLLFLFTFIYRSRPGRTAIYYHDNARLELVWTLIPAVVLAYLVLDGVSVWNKIKDVEAIKAKDPIVVEVVGEQFQWNVRYAGVDNKLGRANYKLIKGVNALGIDPADELGHDDVVADVKELVIPKGMPILVKIRAKDVLHGVYMPQFRQQLYAVPGMPTEFTLTPTATTAEMRDRLGNPEFEYEMACSQLCGEAHWNMRLVIKVVTPEEYQTWLKQQPSWYATKYKKTEEQPAAQQATAPAAPENNKTASR